MTPAAAIPLRLLVLATLCRTVLPKGHQQQQQPGHKSERWKHFFNPGPPEHEGINHNCYQPDPNDESAFPLVCLVSLAQGDHEYRLVKYLMSNYDKSVRPVSNPLEPIVVVFDASLHQIIDVDEKNQILTTNCWISMTWTDSHLTWNASDFGNVSSIRLPFNMVWKPDIILYNNADSNYNNAVINTNVIVSYNGEVIWLQHGIYRSACNISVEHFPFDIQNCTMMWSSWTFDNGSLDMQLRDHSSDGDKSNYQKNGEFALEGYKLQRNEVFYSCCPKNPYIDITYFIILRRRPMFYVFNLILPCILINIIALLVFYVPSESGEKVTLGISALLSMTVFLMTIRESLPPTEKTPLISMYYGVSICLVTCASAMAVVTLNLHYRGFRGNKVPGVVKDLVLGTFAKLVFLKFDMHTQRNAEDEGFSLSQVNVANGGGSSNSRRNNDARNHRGDEDPSICRGPEPPQPNGIVRNICMCPRCPFPVIQDNCCVHSATGVVLTSCPATASMAPNYMHLSNSRMATNQFDEGEEDDESDERGVLSSSTPLHSPTATMEMRRNSRPKMRHQGSSTSSSTSAPTATPGAGVTAGINGPESISPAALLGSEHSHCSRAMEMGAALQALNGHGIMHHSQQQHPVETINGLTEATEALAGITSNDLVSAKICDAIDLYMKSKDEAETRDNITLSWKQVSLVIDRVLLLVFFLAMTIASLVILTSSPHIFTSADELHTEGHQAADECALASSSASEATSAAAESQPLFQPSEG